MPRSSKLIIAFVLLVGAAGFLALQTGLARKAFFELFAFVKGVDVVSPTIIREPAVDSPYEVWLQRVRGEIPVFDGMVIEDISKQALEPWPQLGDGVTGLYLRFADYQMVDGRLLQLPAEGNSASQRHFYEQGVYIVSGSGHTFLQQENRGEQRVEWHAGDLLAIPLNVRHQHFNDGKEPARLLSISSFPMVLNLIDNESFVLKNPHAFTDRYDGEKDYFDPVEGHGEIVVTQNFVTDILNTPTVAFDYRGKGNSSIKWLMAGNSMLSLHISEMPEQSYKKAHRHSSDAFILLLSGSGFSLTWPEGFFEKRKRVDWKAGTLFVPPIFWYHQHFNTGSERARYLAINAPDAVRNLGLRFIDQLETDHEEVVHEWNEAIQKADPAANK